MRPNPGGIIAAAEVLGRDVLVSRIWSSLSGQSVYLTSERRVGKTSVIRKMVAQPHADLLPYFVDIEALYSPQELVEKLASHLLQAVSLKDRGKHLFWSAMAELGGAEIKDLRLPKVARSWKRLLGALVQDVLHRNGAKTLVIFLDEFPWFIDNVEKRLGGPAAMELLDELRALRQEHSRLRFVLTGSIGLHHILDRLRTQGYANQPLNDVNIIEVPPLQATDATRLARELLLGAGVQTEGAVAEEIARLTGGFPYYIHHLVSLAQESGVLKTGQAASLLAQLFRDPHDRANFRHFRKRITEYYGTAQSPHVIAILDHAASRPAARSRDLLNAARYVSADFPEATFLNLLERLQQDHYLARQEDGRWDFRYSVVKQWWLFDRELDVHASTEEPKP